MFPDTVIDLGPLSSLIANLNPLYVPKSVPNWFGLSIRLELAPSPIPAADFSNIPFIGNSCNFKSSNTAIILSNIVDIIAKYELNTRRIWFAFCNIFTNCIITLIGIPIPGGTAVGIGRADIISTITENIVTIIDMVLRVVFTRFRESSTFCITLIALSLANFALFSFVGSFDLLASSIITLVLSTNLLRALL